jgi:hypothetical protein
MPVIGPNGSIGWYYYESAPSPGLGYAGISREPMRPHWRDQPEMYSADELAERKIEALLDIIYPQESR